MRLIFFLFLIFFILLLISLLLRAHLKPHPTLCKVHYMCTLLYNVTVRLTAQHPSVQYFCTPVILSLSLELTLHIFKMAVTSHPGP